MMKTAKDVYELLDAADLPDNFVMNSGVDIVESAIGCSCDVIIDFFYNNGIRYKFLHLIGMFILENYKYSFTTTSYPAIFLCVLTDKQLEVEANQDFLVGMNAQLVYSYYHGAHGNTCNLFLIDKASINWDYIYDILEMELNDEAN